MKRQFKAYWRRIHFLSEDLSALDGSIFVLRSHSEVGGEQSLRLRRYILYDMIYDNSYAVYVSSMRNL